MAYTKKRYKISDADGTNEVHVTLAEYRADLDARRPYTAAIIEAVRRGDAAACARAQAEMRAKFRTGFGRVR